MSSVKRIQFTTVIEAPAARVYALMIDPQSYRDWTSAFAEGSHYEGSWAQGQRIRFLSPSGDGMFAEIAENRPGEFISIRHLGFIAQGVEDTASDSARSWAPAYENYSFQAVPQGTRLVIDQDVTADFEAYMMEAWPKALARLKTLCEDSTAA
ncbi:MAG: SRPBCC domain-containing protein [Burkholderiaceae bacterium]|nr:SRPBCC domain-containing protein [Burkholderiaceae bacterium]